MNNVTKKAYALLISFFCFASSLYSQDQKIADSLAIIYKADTVKGKAKLELLRNLTFNEANDLQLALKYAEELIKLSEKENNYLYLHNGYFQKGNKKRLLGDLDDALEFYIKSSEAAAKANTLTGEGNAYGAIADVYATSQNFNNAKFYYQKAITILRKAKDSIPLASFLLNAGDAHLNAKLYDSALLFFRESEIIFKKSNYEIGIAYNLGNIGMVYANMGRKDLAEKNINAAIKILEDAGDYYPICVYLIFMADIYLDKGDRKTAHIYASRSLQLAQQYGLKDQISDANLKLSQLYEEAKNPAEAFKYYKNFIVYRDSVNNIKSVQNMADMRTDFEVSKKQVEVDLLNQEKRNQQIIVFSMSIILILATIILGTLYWFYRSISKQKKISESLLLNILPAETAMELKKNGKVDAVRIDHVTVLFTDFVSFSKHAEHIEPEQLVKSIDFYFKGFDEITTKYGLEKIKTIGDSYMCACGLPTANPAHAKNVLLAAREMIALVNSVLNAEDELSHFNVRIGVHTGPVVAGIVGIKKWQYDIWGDTVNIASRMESKSEPGRINISETTYQEINGDFDCEYRGEIEVKNRGLLKMYFLN